MKDNNKSNTRTLCLFGTYESRFNRTVTIKNAAKKNGDTIIECHIPFWELSREKGHLFSGKALIKTLLRLGIIYLRLLVKYAQVKDHDVMIVGYNGYFDLPLAKLLAKLRRKPLIFTPLFPLYETLIEDRKYVAKASVKSKIIHKIDGVGGWLADVIIVESDEYIRYYHEEFGVPKEKFSKVPLGADETNFFPRTTPKAVSDQVKVLFYGKFIPLQGIQYIVKAAKLLENDTNIVFEIIGSGQLSEEIHTLAQKLDVKNISFIDWVEYKTLPLHVHHADISLGIFGDTPKALRSIPIKVYEALSMQKPVITGDSPAAREVLTDKENAVLCQMANAEAIAEAIVLLKNDRNLRENIAKEGHKLYHNRLSSTCIARDLEAVLNKVLNFR